MFQSHFRRGTPSGNRNQSSQDIEQGIKKKKKKKNDFDWLCMSTPPWALTHSRLEVCFVFVHSLSLPLSLVFMSILFRNRSAYAFETQGEKLLRSAHNEKVDSGDFLFL